MKRRASSCLLASVLAIGCVASCSLFTSLGGLSGGDSDAGADATSIIDGGGSDAIAPRDSAVDSATGDAGSWAFVASNAETESSDSLPPLSVTSSADVKVGDLVIAACDSGNNAGFITFSGFPTDALSLSILGPRSDGEAYQAEIGWGIVQAPLTGDLQIIGTVQFPASAGFMDCTVNVYRGGAPDAMLVDEEKVIGPDDSGLASCGPLQTAPGGVAFYISARTTCIGAPLDPAFNQRETINGNPNGDVVPTDGGIVQSQLGPCNGSKASWICYMMSLSP